MVSLLPNQWMLTPLVASSTYHALRVFSGQAEPDRTDYHPILDFRPLVLLLHFTVLFICNSSIPIFSSVTPSITRRLRAPPNDTWATHQLPVPHTISEIVLPHDGPNIPQKVDDLSPHAGQRDLEACKGSSSALTSDSPGTFIALEALYIISIAASLPASSPL
ncbi:hypothetical protein CVT26_001504 [Gymnopilus dilepis]|uniref:Uncharacterized protein n=1 Tax=Gymnopilus dilepis TaxID=231916 RepID=A0A409YXB3_9AGAR|nr:hypothetical protein CVT26_001504 [Gymnopilus dilepis]